MILDRLFERRAESINLAHPGDAGLVDMFGIGQDTVSGINVTEATALNCSAVYSAVKAIAETIGGLDRAVYEISENGDSELLTDDDITQLINGEPNRNMTPAVFWEALQAYLLLWGNAFAEIERDRLGDPIALWPRHPARVNIQRRETGELVYQVYPADGASGEAKTVLAADMLHVPCMGTGEVGVSVISYARESIGVGMASERYGGAFFGNGAKPGGILKLARPANRERKRQIAEDWAREFSGPQNASRLAVIDHESEYTAIGIPPEDAQFLETRQFQVQEVCRWFRISPTKLMDFSRATFSNIEEINKQFASETILPWAIKWNQECRRKLIDVDRRRNHVVRHDISKLVEGDLDTLTQIFSRGRQWGWYSINDVRRKLGENTIGEDGDEYLTPANMLPVGEEPKEPEEPDPQQQQMPAVGDQQDPPQAQAEAIRSEFQALRDELKSLRGMQVAMREELVAAIHAKYVRKSIAELRRASTKTNVLAHMTRYLDNLEPKLRAELETVTPRAAEDASVHVAGTRQSLLAALECQAEQLPAALDSLALEWSLRYAIPA